MRCELPLCNQFDVCKIVHNHYWGQNEVVTSCQCPEGTACLDKFNEDGMSLKVNHRTQMKFCEKLDDIYGHLKECVDDNITISLTVRTLYLLDQIQNYTATIHCKIPQNTPIYWRQLQNLEHGLERNENYTEIIEYFKHQCDK